jgi:hypothetical protein
MEEATHDDELFCHSAKPPKQLGEGASRSSQLLFGEFVVKYQTRMSS